MSSIFAKYFYKTPSRILNIWFFGTFSHASAGLVVGCIKTKSLDEICKTFHSIMLLSQQTFANIDRF